MIDQPSKTRSLHFVACPPPSLTLSGTHHARTRWLEDTLPDSGGNDHTDHPIPPCIIVTTTSCVLIRLLVVHAAVYPHFPSNFSSHVIRSRTSRYHRWWCQIAIPRRNHSFMEVPPGGFHGQITQDSRIELRPACHCRSFGAGTTVSNGRVSWISPRHIDADVAK